MQLAIDILRSEFESYKQCLRTEGKYSVYPEYRGPNVDFAHNIAELQAAIAHLVLAVLFHSTYERLAPAFGWRTKKGCNVPFERLPSRNQALMNATCQTVLNALQEQSSPALPAYNNASPKLLGELMGILDSSNFISVSKRNRVYEIIEQLRAIA